MRIIMLKWLIARAAGWLARHGGAAPELAGLRRREAAASIPRSSPVAPLSELLAELDDDRGDR
jgi:hypothetical protein